MKPTIGITMRQDLFQPYSELRDSLDSKWYDFFNFVGIDLLPIPNSVKTVSELLKKIDFSGFVFSGGGDITALSKDTKKSREFIEELLLQNALKKNIPVLGVCRGMQKIQDVFGASFDKIAGHVGVTVQHRRIDGASFTRKSFHRFGTKGETTGFYTTVFSEDNTVKAISSKNQKIIGIMWHPERESPFYNEDIELFKKHFLRT